MTDWPTNLPQNFLLPSYKSEFGDGRIMTETDSGTPKVRKRFSAVTRTVNGVMLMTDAQLASFKTFFEVTTGGGVKPFNFPAQETSGTWVVRFGKNVPTWSRNDAVWSVEIELVVLP